MPDRSEDRRPGSAPLSIAWAIRPYFDKGLRQGYTLRWAGLAGALRARGHRVDLLVVDPPGAPPPADGRWLDELVRGGVIDQVVRIPGWSAPRAARVGSFAAGLPTLRFRLLRRWWKGPFAELVNALERLRTDALVIGTRQLTPFLPHLPDSLPAVVDWCDCEVLARARALRNALGARKFRMAGRQVIRLLRSAEEEMVYGRRAAANLVASPRDKATLDLVTRTPHRNHLLPNGVRDPGRPAAGPPPPKRLIFSGNMDFPPNVDAAVWFIDRVLPLVRESHPDVELAIAGQNPAAAIRERASPGVRVLGFVEDLDAELRASTLYVASMVSGSGFKNKVVEALVNGLFVVSTPLGVEFLPPDIRGLIPVGATPRAFADEVVAYLDRPGAFAAQLHAAREAVLARFRWEARGAELEGLLRDCISARAARREASGPPR